VIAAPLPVSRFSPRRPVRPSAAPKPANSAKRGIIQTDVLDEIKCNPLFPGVGKYLEYVTKLYDEQLHVLVGPDIQSLSDLRGKKVNFGRRNSGTYTTATNIFKAIGVQPNVTTLPHALALDQLRRGEISGMVYVGTKPSRMF
jgi:uncharacterized protein